MDLKHNLSDYRRDYIVRQAQSRFHTVLSTTVTILVSIAVYFGILSIATASAVGSLGNPTENPEFVLLSLVISAAGTKTLRSSLAFMALPGEIPEFVLPEEEQEFRKPVSLFLLISVMAFTLFGGAVFLGQAVVNLGFYTQFQYLLDILTFGKFGTGGDINVFAFLLGAAGVLGLSSSVVGLYSSFLLGAYSLYPWLIGAYSLVFKKFYNLVEYVGLDDEKDRCPACAHAHITSIRSDEYSGLYCSRCWVQRDLSTSDDESQ